MAKQKGKFILSVGDEGGILTYMHGKTVERRFFAPTSNYADTKAFVEALQSNPDAPIVMLVDVMDQSYVQQSLPPVSALSINNLIKRKMQRDFAAEDLKGALQIGREKEGRRDWKYLFVTLSRTPQLEAWLDLVMELPNHFSGIYLLPVEAEHFIHRLRDGISGKTGKKNPAEVESKWQLLVAHNKVGGFRQVVLKNGKLIFARLAQPIGDNQPEVIAGNIEQEISVTTEYLKRLGYTDDQGMDVYVIASEAIKASIDDKNINATAAYVMSPHEAALKIGLDQVTDANDQFADVLMAAAFATAKKHSLKLQTPALEKLNQLYNGILAVKAGGALLVIAAIAAMGYYGYLVPGAKEEIGDYQAQIGTAEEKLLQVKEQEKKLPDDLERMTDLVAIHQLLNNLGFTPMDTLYRLNNVADEESNVLFTEIKWAVTNTLLTQDNRAAKNVRGRAAAAPDKAASYENLTLSIGLDMYGTQVGSKEFNRRVDVFTQKLRNQFPGFTVNMMSERPGNIDKTAAFTIGEETIDPILLSPFYGLKYNIEGTGVVDEKDASTTGKDARAKR